MTKYCNVIGPHYKVWGDTACVHSSPFLVEVGVACETVLYVHVQWMCMCTRQCGMVNMWNKFHEREFNHELIHHKQHHTYPQHQGPWIGLLSIFQQGNTRPRHSDRNIHLWGAFLSGLGMRLRGFGTRLRLWSVFGLGILLFTPSGSRFSIIGFQFPTHFGERLEWRGYKVDQGQNELEVDQHFNTLHINCHWK